MKILDEIENPEGKDGEKMFLFLMAINELALAYSGIIITEFEQMDEKGEFIKKEKIFYPLFLIN